MNKASKEKPCDQGAILITSMKTSVLHLHFVAVFLVVMFALPALCAPKSLFITLDSSMDTSLIVAAMNVVKAQPAEYRIEDLVVQYAAEGMNGPLFVDELRVLLSYRSLFQNVWIGTHFAPYPGDPNGLYTTALLNSTWIEQNVARASAVAKAYVSLFGPPSGWYISYEANGNYFVEYPSVLKGYQVMLQQWTQGMSAVKALPILWSPNHWSFYREIHPPSLQSAWRGLFEAVPLLGRVDLQDFCGQTVTWTPPYHYNYDHAHTCENDALPYWRLVSQAAQHKVDVRINMEVFAMNNVSLVPPDPAEFGSREDCYVAAGAHIGACFEIFNWVKVTQYGR